MAYEWSVIEAFEVHDTRREWFDGDGRYHASVLLQVDWRDRFKLIQDLYTSQFGALKAPAIGGYNPRAYPDDGAGASVTPGISNPIMNTIGVTSATIRTWKECGFPRDASNQVLEYKTSAFVDVQYGRQWNIEESLEFDVEVVTQSYLNFRWKTKLYPKDQRLVNELEVPVSTFYSAIFTRDIIGLAPKSSIVGDILVPDYPTIFDSVGKYNAEEFISTQQGFTFPPGTLLMIEPDVRESMDMQNVSPSNLFGNSGKAVTIKFLYKKGGEEQGEDENTHNLFWRPTKTYGEGLDTFHGDWDQMLVPVPGTNNNAWVPYRPFKEGAKISSDWLIPAMRPLPVS